MSGIQGTAHPERPSNLFFIDTEREAVDECEATLQSLTEVPPRISPKYFYDSRGSTLFEGITELPEYYLTRAEAEIFRDHGEAIAAVIRPGDTLIEPGSGNCEKVRHLLAYASPGSYVPIDIAGDFLLDAASRIALEWPSLEVTAVAADFTQAWTFEDQLPAGRRVMFYPGSTLGNFEPEAQRSFIQRLSRIIGGDGGILLGVDLHKDATLLQQAYDDSAGVTAAFNRNMLRVVNDQLGADFQPEQWHHEARYNPRERRIEMDLVAGTAQQVSLGGQVLEFPAGSAIRTEHSYKFTLDDLSKLAAASNLRLAQHWLDTGNRFCLAFLAAT